MNKFLLLLAKLKPKIQQCKQYFKYQFTQDLSRFWAWLLVYFNQLYQHLIYLGKLAWAKLQPILSKLRIQLLAFWARLRISRPYPTTIPQFKDGYVWLLGGLFLATLVFILVGQTISAPHIGQAEKITRIQIPAGANLTQISQIVAEHGARPFIFSILVRLSGHAESLKRGEYQFNGQISYLDLVQILRIGQVNLVKITFAEGTNIREVFAQLKKLNLKNAGEYQKYATDPVFLKQVGLAGRRNIEGYLFPETYFFNKEANEKQVLQEMVQTFFDKVSPDYAQKSQAVGLTFYEAIILASMIEKETGYDGERTTISSVFHNRIKKEMRLDSDPTIIYGIPNFNGNITHKDLQTPTDYNTYTFIGLPPTPIANPGLASLNAAVNPKDTKYLFFVSKGDGRSYFSETYRQHVNAVNRYQR